MKPRHGAVSTTLLTVAGLCGLGAAGLSVVTGVTPCSLVGSCTTETAAPVAMTVCDSEKAEKELTLVSAESAGECETSCSDEAKAVAVNASECATACEGEAKAVAVNASECATACDDKAAAKLVSGKGKGACETSCDGEGKAIAVNAGACETECSDEQAVTLVAGEGDCCGECAEDSATGALPVAVHAFNTDCPYSGDAVDASVYAKYNGMKVAFCCNGCKGRFNKADEAKQAKLVANVVTPINSTCCDKPVDASTVSVINGFPVAQCSSACSDYVAKAPADKQAAFVASLIKTVNDECCGTSAAEATMVGFHNGKAVALCGEKCAEHFNAASAEKKDAWFAKLASNKAGACEGEEACETECTDAQKAACGDDCNSDCKADA